MPQLVEKYKPTVISDFVGLERPKAIMTKFLRDPYASAFLFVGPSGIGKTCFADAIAAQLGGDVHMVASKSCDQQKIADICEKCAYMPWFGRWHVIVINEANLITEGAQLALLSRLDGTAPVADTIWLLTANSDKQLEDRLLSRLRTIHFDTTGIEAAGAEYLARIHELETQGQAGAIPPDFGAIMRASKNNLRSAVTTLEMELLCPSEPHPAVERPRLQIVPAPIRPADWLSSITEAVNG